MSRLDLPRLWIAELVSISPQRATPLAGNLTGDTGDPRPESLPVAQPRKVSVRTQETFLRHVFDSAPIARHTGHDNAHRRRVTVVQIAERLAVSRKRFAYKLSIVFGAGFHAQRTSGRRRFVQHISQ
jgi:hypothetical protein